MSYFLNDMAYFKRRYERYMEEVAKQADAGLRSGVVSTVGGGGHIARAVLNDISEKRNNLKNQRKLGYRLAENKIALKKSQGGYGNHFRQLPQDELLTRPSLKRNLNSDIKTNYNIGSLTERQNALKRRMVNRGQLMTPGANKSLYTNVTPPPQPPKQTVSTAQPKPKVTTPKPEPNLRGAMPKELKQPKQFTVLKSLPKKAPKNYKLIAGIGLGTAGLLGAGYAADRLMNERRKRKWPF